jgi:hypothetical protein
MSNAPLACGAVVDDQLGGADRSLSEVLARIRNEILGVGYDMQPVGDLDPEVADAIKARILGQAD